MKKSLVRRFLVSCVALLALGSQFAVAWDGAITGSSIGQVDVTDAGNLGFRITFTSPVAMRGNANVFACLNAADSN
jgi:hypothetical protein